MTTPLQALRHKKKLNQVAFAKALNITQGTVSKIEKGQLKPSITLLANLRKVFKVNLNKFIEESL